MKDEAQELLDKFALGALQGMLAHSKRYRIRAGKMSMTWHEAISEEAYEIARAMVSQRNKPHTW